MKPLIALLAVAAYAQITGPSQAASGPGGTNYSYGVVTFGPYWASGHAGDDAYRYYIYQPYCPTPTTAPVIAFFHGLDAISPDTYTWWIYHLARKGYTVVWMQFQVPGTTALADFKTISVATFADALAKIESSGIYIQPYKVSSVIQTAYVGHSVGAAVAASVASLAVSGGAIPVPLGHFGSNPGLDTSPPSLAGIPSSFKMLLLVGDDDNLVCKAGATTLWAGTTHLTLRNFLVAFSDSHGSVGNDLDANHIFPTTAIRNAYDYYAIWKLSVAVVGCSIFGTNCDIGLSSGGAAQLYMGLWSDTTPVVTLGYYASPSAVTLACE